MFKLLIALLGAVLVIPIAVAVVAAFMGLVLVGWWGAGIVILFLLFNRRTQSDVNRPPVRWKHRRDDHILREREAREREYQERIKRKAGMTDADCSD